MLRTKTLGPLYIGYEAFTPQPRRLSRAWFRHVAPPWKEGRGIRLRLGMRAVQVGVCRRVKDAEPTALSQLGGYELASRPEEIGRWGQDGTAGLEREEGAAGDG